MASPRPPLSAGQDGEGPDTTPPGELSALAQGPKMRNENLATQSTDPNQGHASHSDLLAEASTSAHVEPAGAHVEPAKLEQPEPGVQKADAQDRSTVSPASQQPQTPSGDPATWWKRVGNVKNLNIKIGAPKPKPPASGISSTKKPEAAKAGSAKPGDQGKPLEADKIGGTKPKSNVPELPALVDLSNWPTPVLPSIDVIAVHDLGQSLSTAWAYIPEKAPSKKPGVPTKQPYPTANPTARPVNASQPVAAGDSAAFKAGLRALQDATKERGGREGRGLAHVAGWTVAVEPLDTPALDLKGKAPEQVTLSHVPPDVTQDDEAPMARAGDLHAELMDKAEERADGDRGTFTHGVSVAGDAERGRQLGSQLRVEEPTTHETGEHKAGQDDEDRISRHSNRPSSTKGSKAPSSRKGSKPPSEKDKVSKAGNWLTDRTMLAGDLDRARVLAFVYKTLEPVAPTDKSSKKPDYDKHLKDTTAALLTKIRAQRMGASSNVPLVFIATGFGALVIQRLVSLLDESEGGSAILGMIAGIIFFDAPNTAPKATLKTEEGKTGPILPSPANSSRTARIKAVLDSKTINTGDLWAWFHDTIKTKNLSTVWFHPTQKAVPPRAKGIDFVVMDAVQAKSTTTRVSSRFRSPWDPNYRCLVDQIKRCLILKASTDKRLEELLAQFIDWGYDLSVKDHNQRCPLHLAADSANDAALVRLVSARPGLVTERDRYKLTPLHIAVSRTVTNNPNDDDRGPFRMMIEKLVSAMGDTVDENQHGKNLEDDSDTSEDSLWGCARDDKKYDWIMQLKDTPRMFNGARVAQAKTLDDIIHPITRTEAKACKKLDATLAQFYIAKDGSTDYLDLQRTWVHGAIYDELYGIEKLFDRNLRPDEDKRTTCRWIHLPANNEKWVQDLFARQLRRIDKPLKPRRHEGTAPFDRHIRPTASRYKQIYEPRPADAPFPSPGYSFPSPSFAVGSADESGSVKKTVTALFMPVFGFETHENRKKLSAAMAKPDQAGSSETARLISAYFDNKDFPLHCRRTLDQFTYHMLEDTERRDNTQVMFKWTKKDQTKKRKGSKPTSRHRRSYPLLMVDQLWLWILEDEQTVITSLPNTWESAEEYNLVQHLTRHELRDNDERPLIEGSMDLANSIIRCSVDFLHRKGPYGVTLYESFQSSITIISEEQAVQFDEFKLLVKNLNRGGLDQQKRATLTDALFRLTVETRLLAEIMDIQDELKTIHEVFLKQRHALKKFVQLLSNDQHQSGADDESDILETPGSSHYASSFVEDTDPFESPDLYRERKPLQSAFFKEGRTRARRTVQFADERVPYQRSKSGMSAARNLEQVENNIATIKEMTTYAEKVRVEINGLLSHRQKQANAWEARFAREGSDHTQRQSKITLVFTMVTVFFLPLSFMSSVFAIQIDAFPHNAETGEVNWPLRQALGLLFGISFGMILVVAFLGFYVNRIPRFFTKHFGGASTTPGASERGRHYDSDSDSERSSILTGSRRGGRTGKFSKTARRSQDRNSEPPASSLNSATDESQEYAPLFGLWHFHTKIPLIGELWKYRHYQFDQEKRLRTSSPVPDGSSAKQSARRAAEEAGDSASSGWGEDADSVAGYIWDYPVHRAYMIVAVFVFQKVMRPVGLIPAWLKEEDKEDQLDVDGDGEDVEAVGEDSVRSSMRRSAVAGTEDSWGVPAPPLRRRNTQLKPTKANIIAGLVPSRWREANTGARHNAPPSSEGSAGSAATSVNVALSVHEGDPPEGRRGMFPVFSRRKKMKEHDLEKGLAR